MLAERKRKTKWVVNPTKKPLWITDSNGIKYGKDLMEKMGWSAGKGLGVNEQGIQEPLKLSYKNDTKGMGFKGNDDDWTEHQDEFNEFLYQLRNGNNSSITNISKEERVTKSLEEKSKQSRARVHYQKFTRGKDLSRYSDHDLACILGTNKIKKDDSKPEGLIQSESKVIDNCETSFGVTTINSGSIQDYFKKKWIVNEKFNNSSYKFEYVGEISSESNQNTESYFVKNKHNLVSETEEKFEKVKYKSDFEEYLHINKSSDLNKLQNSENDVKKKRKREFEEINAEVRTKKKKKYENDNGNHLKNTLNYEELKSSSNEVDDYSSKKKRRKEKSLLKLDVTENDKNYEYVIKNEKKKSIVNNYSSEVSLTEKLSTANLEFASEEEVNKIRKKKKSQKEKLKEINNPENEDCCYTSAVHLSNQSCDNVIEFCTEIGLIKKKKKKESEEKYLMNKNIEENSYNNNENELFYEQDEEKSKTANGEKINRMFERNDVSDISNIKIKKNKKRKKEKLEVQERTINCQNGSFETFNLEEKCRKTSTNTNKPENTLEIQSHKKKKKKKDKKEKSDKKENEDIQLSCNRIKKSVLSEASEKATNSNIIMNTVQQETLMENELHQKKNKQKQRKEKSDEKENENVHLSGNPVERSIISETLKKTTNSNIIMDTVEEKTVVEDELHRKKKKKKERNEKSDKKENEDIQLSCNRTEKSVLSEASEKTTNSIIITDTVQQETVMENEFHRKKKKKKERKENEDIQLSGNPVERSILSETLEKTNNGNIVSGAVEEESVEEGESRQKKKKKKGKKENKKDERENENLNCYTNNDVRVQVQENTIELDLVKEKKRKKEKVEKLEEKEKAKRKFSWNRMDENSLKETSKKTNINDLNVDSVQTELVQKKKCKKEEKLKLVENEEMENEESCKGSLLEDKKKVQKHERAEEFNSGKVDKKINLNFRNKCNTNHFRVNENVGGGAGVHKHKVELLDEKRADKFYPGQHTKDRVLRLMYWSNIGAFKGSNLGNLTGYGYLS